MNVLGLLYFPWKFVLRIIATRSEIVVLIAGLHFFGIDVEVCFTKCFNNKCDVNAMLMKKIA